MASDTHEQHGMTAVPDGDVFIHAGDFTYRGDLKAIKTFGSWLQSLPHERKIIIAGNHDWAFERQPIAARSAIGDGRGGVTYLQDSGVTIAGISFWGSPWQPWFYDWAFNIQRGPQIAAKWAAIPLGTAVLVTHGPPSDILDSTGAESVGCADLNRRVSEIRPRVHVFKYIHESSGVIVQDGITYVNASICDGARSDSSIVVVLNAKCYPEVCQGAVISGTKDCPRRLEP